MVTLLCASVVCCVAALRPVAAGEPASQAASQIASGAALQTSAASSQPAEELAALVRRLREAFDSGSAPQKVAALRSSSLHADESVVAQVRRGLEDRDVDVRLATYDALGRNAHESAFAALLAHQRAKRKELRTLERDLPALLTALARRGDARALPALVDDLQAQRLVATVRARILGLARIRSKAAVEALMKLADEIGFVDMHNHLEDFRLALVVLSGVDHGRSLDAWRAWWNSARGTFEPQERMAPLAPKDAARWREHWGEGPAGEQLR